MIFHLATAESSAEMRPPSKSISLYYMLIFLLCAAVSDAQSTCYRPDGVAAPASYQPCNTTAPASMCCNIGYGEACNSIIGLCGSSSALWRESCTDPTWQAPECLRLCITGPSKSMGRVLNNGCRVSINADDGHRL